MRIIIYYNLRHNRRFKSRNNLLFGIKGLSDGWAILAYTGISEDLKPELILKKNSQDQQV
jgi:hypothetical protein